MRVATMNWQEILQSLGINPAVLFAGGAGGVLRALSRKKLKVREMILSPICGALAAAYLTLPVVHYLLAVGIPLPSEPEPAILATGFLVGSSAMWVSDIIFEAVVSRFIRNSPPA